MKQSFASSTARLHAEQSSGVALARSVRRYSPTPEDIEYMNNMLLAVMKNRTTKVQRHSEIGRALQQQFLAQTEISQRNSFFAPTAHVQRDDPTSPIENSGCGAEENDDDDDLDVILRLSEVDQGPAKSSHRLEMDRIHAGLDSCPAGWTQLIVEIKKELGGLIVGAKFCKANGIVQSLKGQARIRFLKPTESRRIGATKRAFLIIEGDSEETVNEAEDKLLIRISEVCAGPPHVHQETRKLLKLPAAANRSMGQVPRAKGALLKKQLLVASAAPPAIKEDQKERACSAIDDEECIFCLCKPKSIVILPCRHCVYCDDCQVYLKDACPCCRGSIESLIQMGRLTDIDGL